MIGWVSAPSGQERDFILGLQGWEVQAKMSRPIANANANAKANASTRRKEAEVKGQDRFGANVFWDMVTVGKPLVETVAAPTLRESQGQSRRFCVCVCVCVYE